MILDIGAHLGSFSLFISSLNEKIKIISFEPFEGNFDLLQKNIQLNKTNCVCRRLAITGFSKTRELNLSQKNQNHSIEKPFYDLEKSTLIQVKSINDIFKEEGIENCDLLKIDAEGAEFEILENCSRETFKKISSIYLEYHLNFGRKLEDLKKVLKENNFKVLINKKSKYSKYLGMILASK